MARQTQTLIIGAGPGGYVAALKLGQLGRKALLVDRDALGGECLNYGCIPSKALISAARLVHRAKNSKEAGIELEGLRVNLEKLQAWKEGLIRSLQGGIQTLCRGNQVEVLKGTARFLSPKEAEVASDGQGPEKVAFENAVVATGSSPMELPKFKLDGSRVLSSKEALELRRLPQRLTVIGGGVIGLEIGTLYAQLGSQVTVVEYMDQLLAGISPDLVQVVVKSLKKMGVEVYTGSKALEYRQKEGALEVVIQTPQGSVQVVADRILLSVGRRPHTENLGLEALGVRLDEQGFIRAGENFETTVSGIYAIGDVAGPPFLAHKASREGVLLAEFLCGKVRSPAWNGIKGLVPWAIFTDPEIAAVGLSEKEAKAGGREVLAGRFPFAASGRALTSREPEGFVKVIADKESQKILGAEMVGPEASDLISEACLAIRLGATLSDVASTIHPHPTLPEAFHEAAEAALGQAIHLLAKKA